MIAGSVAPDVAAAFYARVAREGRRTSHVLESIIAAGLAALDARDPLDSSEVPTIRV